MDAVSQLVRRGMRQGARKIALLALIALSQFMLMHGTAQASRLKPSFQNRRGSYMAWMQRAPRARFNPFAAPELQSAGWQFQLPATPYFDYLYWRRSLNPARFDYYHPWLGRAFQMEDLTRPLCRPPAVGGEIITGPNQPPKPPVVIPQVTDPPAVPEPSSLLILGALFASGAYARHWRRRSAGPGS